MFLHGYLSSKESFLREIEYFSNEYRVTALDFPGMGGAETLKEAWSVDDYADWTQEAAASLGLGEPALMAHSFGGRVALKLLARGKASCAVLIGCAGVLPKRGAVYRMKVGAYRFFRHVAPAFAERRFGSEDYKRLSPVMKESFKKIVNEDLCKTASEISRPVLFLNGERDTETPVGDVKKLHACVRGSRMICLKGCGHFAHLDDPLAVRLAAEEFYHDHI